MEHRITLWVETEATAEEVRDALFAASRPGWLSSNTVLDERVGQTIGFNAEVIDYTVEEGEGE